MTGDEFTALLRRLGHTQVTAADALGVTRQTIATWMRADQLTRRTEHQIVTLRPIDETDQATADLLPLVQRLITGKLE